MGKSYHFTMPFETMTIEHLGLRLYSTLPPVIGELVSNAFDAESKLATVTLPEGTIDESSEVVVRDFGHGMNANELQNEYLPIGRPRRGVRGKNVMSKNKKRRVTGRKGLGKLSAFGIAKEMELRSVSNGNAICILLNYDEMRQWSIEHPGEPFRPRVVESRTGRTTDKNGTEVRLRKMSRTRSINAGHVRRGLAQRLDFIGKGFVVKVNGTPIGPGDRVRKEDCRTADEDSSWFVPELPHLGKVAPGLTVTGWVGFLPKSNQTGRGVSIFAHKKAVELGSFFDYPSTDVQFARAYLVGEIHADFLDEDEDLASTARTSVLWESTSGVALRNWGRKTMKWAFDQWKELRRTQKTENVIKVAGFDKWLELRLPSEQRVAQRMVKLLVDDPDLDPESTAPLLEIVKSSVETVAFRELIETIEEQGHRPATMLRLFEEWRIIEAREHLKLADGRLSAMEQLELFMKTGALEVQEMQPLFEKNPWLLNPAWKESDGQTTYTKMIRRYCKEPKSLPEEERRLDIFGITSGGAITIVELKRPEKTLSADDLEQIERYTDWASEKIVGSSGASPKYANGLLVVGEHNARLQRKVRRLAGSDIRVATYEDLRTLAREYYGQVEENLRQLAPEYARSRRLRASAAKKQVASKAKSTRVRKRKSGKKKTTKKTALKKTAKKPRRKP